MCVWLIADLLCQSARIRMLDADIDLTDEGFHGHSVVLLSCGTHRADGSPLERASQLERGRARETEGVFFGPGLSLWLRAGAQRKSKSTS